MFRRPKRSERRPKMGRAAVEVRRYMEKTQLNRLRPPRLATTVGMAVPMIVLSRAARAMAMSTAMTTCHFFRSMLTT